MPIKDKEINREYQKIWSRLRASRETPSEKEVRLTKRREWRKKRCANSSRERDYNKAYRARPDIRYRDHINRLKQDYGEWWEAKLVFDELSAIIWSDKAFEVIDYIKGEKHRTDRVRVKKPFVRNDDSGERGKDGA